MPRITIQQFRAILTSRADANAAVRGYRELARRPELAVGMRALDWVTWPPAASVQANT